MASTATLKKGKVCMFKEPDENTFYELSGNIEHAGFKKIRCLLFGELLIYLKK